MDQFGYRDGEARQADASNAWGVQIGHGNTQNNTYVREAPPHYSLAGWATGPPRPVETLRLAELLDARHQVVPFLGRQEELRSLRQWLAPDKHDPDRAIRLVHAPGGQGKTRLAAEFAEAARTAGWEVLRAHRDPAGTSTLPRPRRKAGGLLVVVDYCDRWPASDLRALFTDPRLHRTGPVRLLLLARSTGYWWQALRYWLSTLGVVAEEHELSALAADNKTRERLFRTAVVRFAALIPHARTDAVRDPDLNNPVYSTALALELAALVAVAASRDEGAPAGSTLEDMYGYLLDREVEHWRQLFDGGAVPSSPEQLDRAVLAATLAGPVPYETGEAILAVPGVAGGPTGVPQLLADHTSCYPAATAGSVLEPLRPDRLGEAYLALALPGHGHRSYPSKPWALGGVRALIRGKDLPPDTAARVRASALTILVEVAVGWRHVGTAVILPLLRDDPALAVAAGGAVLAKIIGLPGVDNDLLARIEPFLPFGRHIDFDSVARDVTARLTRDRLAQDPDPIERARLHITYGRRLAFAGEREAALAEIELAVAAGRAAHAAGPSAETSVLLARALHLRGHRLAAVNRHSAALASVEEAVRILTPLVDGREPEAYRLALAESLDNLGIRLSTMKRHSEAEKVSRRAVELFSDSSPESDAELVGLAGALANLGMIEAHLERPVEALVSALRAERIWRQISEREPSVHLPELATALTSVGLRHAELGNLPEAVTVTEEAVQIFRDLVRVNAVAFERELASVLANLCGYLGELGRRVEALRLIVEAEAVFSRWGEANPEAFDLHLRRLRDSIEEMRGKQSTTDLRRWELGANSFNS